MATSRSEAAKSHNFSLAFEQMCFVAIASRESPDDVLRQLVLQCFVVLPDEQFSNANQIIEAIDVLFGLRVPHYQVQAALDHLEDKGLLQRPLKTNYILEPEARKRLQERLEAAQTLEDRVREEWFKELTAAFPDLLHKQMWNALRSYLAKSFRRHGIQAAALLDPSIETPIDYSVSLSSLLDDALKETFANDNKAVAQVRKAISHFFASIGESPDLATYIAQLADGAFSYFTLTVDPDTARIFRENLQPLTLFLDTNFLFAVLDLHSNPMVEVSNEVLRVVQQFGLPFSLCYHERTARELDSTIGYYGDRLRARHWSQQLSKAAANIPYLSGIEAKYHQRNAVSPTDVEAFLRPYEHADVLLANKDISVSRSESSRLKERADLLHEYSDFLNTRKKPKLDTIIDHDVTVLDAVRQRRSAAKSTLDAGALLLTCDYYLYRFDWEQSRAKGLRACVVLPNLFMQILRPFIPSNPDFDRSFAETFAIPEFRTVGSGAADAASRVLNLIAGYAAFPEETAVRLLSNDLLLDQLKDIRDDEEFQRQVELAIANENATLLEEMAALKQQLEHQQEVAKAEKEKATFEAHKERQARQEAEQTADRYKCASALLISVFAAVAFFGGVHWLEWRWLLDHPNGYGLQALAGLFIFLLLLGLLYPKWRKSAWGGSGASGVVLVMFALLGGKN